MVDQGSGQGAKRFESRVSEHTRKYVSILNRFDKLLNIHKKRCEIPLRRGNAAMDT